MPIRISTALLKDSQGAVIGGVETFQDLTQVEQLQKELRARYTFEDIIGLESGHDALCSKSCRRFPPATAPC